MTCFQDLPNELILVVLEAVLPEDLENFAAVCMRIHDLSKPLLVQHRELIRKYSSPRDNNPEGDWSLVVDVLKKVQTDPRVGHYVRTLDIWILIAGHIYHKFDIDLPVKKDLEICQKAATDSGHFASVRANHTSQYEGWMSDMERFDENVLLALLLPLLPNLTTLKIPRPGDCQDCLSSMIAYASVSTTPMLPKLRNLSLHRSCVTEDNACKTIRPYAELPSLRNLSMFSWSDGPWIKQLEPKFNTNVSNLELWACTINLEDLCKFLRQFRLKIFSYSSGLEERKGNYPTPSPLYQALVETSRSTLRSLSCFANPEQIGHPGRTSDLKILCELHIKWELLLLDEQDTMGMHMLPASLRSLEIRDTGGYYTEQYLMLIEAVIRAKDSGDLHIRHLCLRGWQTDLPTKQSLGATKVLKERCLHAGIELEVYLQEEHTCRVHEYPATIDGQSQIPMEL